MSVSIKDVKKGTRVILRNGFKAIVEDNKTTSHTRLVTVQNHFNDMGSVYATDIVEAMEEGIWFVVQHSPAQLKAAQARKGWGF
jgi:hypothetical protein